MVEAAIVPSLRAVTALRPYIEPALRHVGWFACFLMLAPVVGPRGYGLFIVALSGVAIAEAILVETATGAHADLSVLEARHLSTALVTTIAAAAGVTLMLQGIGRTLGSMVDEAVVDIFQPLSLLPLLGALTVVPAALLRRDGRRAPGVASIAAGLAGGGGVALTLAWAGAGPWSLVAQIIVQRFLECAVLWALTGARRYRLVAAAFRRACRRGRSARIARRLADRVALWALPHRGNDARTDRRRALHAGVANSRSRERHLSRQGGVAGR
jgi:hypothetical protein